MYAVMRSDCVGRSDAQAVSQPTTATFTSGLQHPHHVSRINPDQIAAFAAIQIDARQLGDAGSYTPAWPGAPNGLVPPT